MASFTPKPIEEIVQQHRPYSPRQCSCGWQGDSFGVHFLDSVQANGYMVTPPKMAEYDGPVV